jgi:hydrogenase nickel incorporation protein HypA/HybF
MHELAVCQSMMGQLRDLARSHRARRVTGVVVDIGPLSGVVPELLQQAWPVARAGSVADGAELVTRDSPVRVSCTCCGKETSATPNRLVCGLCGDWRTVLISGDELILASVELEKGDSHLLGDEEHV